ncbi:MAG: M20 family peptidase [Anaerolineaceae bacterium]|nr:M20 family peptidase [Anaerolineaceae bacterium]
MNYLLYVLLTVLVFVIVMIMVRAFRFGNAESSKVDSVSLPVVDSDRLAAHLSDAIQCKTLSYLDVEKVDPAPFQALHEVLEKNYPLIYKKLKCEVQDGFNLVYHWEGRSKELDPILLMAHQDVVPADPVTLDQWKQAPFSGEIVDGVIWGRGTLDCKGQLVGVMEAIEYLLSTGYEPERSIYLAFGQDEEVGGQTGQNLISRKFKEDGIHFAAVLDEGGAILSGQIPGVEVPVALIANCEKGYVTLEIKAKGDGGHSSMPPQVTTIGRLAKGLAKIEANPVPYNVERIIPMFEALGKRAPFMYRLAFSNLWLFRGFLQKKLQENPKMAAIIHSTTAITMINGGVKDNILPSKASAIVNFRLSSGDSIQHLIEYVKFLVEPYDLSVSVAGEHPWEASPVSNVESPAFDLLSTCIQEAFGEVAVTPFVMLGATDARYYSDLSEHVYRFGPVRMRSDQLDSVHNINEHITIEQFTETVQFFVLLMKKWAKAKWVE